MHHLRPLVAVPLQCIMTIRNTYALSAYTSEPKKTTKLYTILQFTNVHYTCTYVHTCTHAQTRVHPLYHTPTHTHPHTHTHTHTHTQILMHTRPQLGKHLSMNPASTNKSLLSVWLTLLYEQFSKWYIWEVPGDGVVQSTDICPCTCRGRVRVVVMDGNGIQLASSN